MLYYLSSNTTYRQTMGNVIGVDVTANAWHQKIFRGYFLHIFAAVMPHFVIEYIQDETYVKL